jgi:outer membrane protein OmpA-like peptidoglycan-associated protein
MIKYIHHGKMLAKQNPLGQKVIRFSQRLLLATLIALLMASCSTPPLKPLAQSIAEQQKASALNAQAAQNIAHPTTTKPSNKANAPLSISEKGKFLYSILIDRNVAEINPITKLYELSPEEKNSLFTILLPNSKVDKSTRESHELIKVYSSGVHPDYNYEREPKLDSIFIDKTFNSILTRNQNLQNNVMFSTSFDEEKFLNIAKVAVDWVEKNIKFAVSMITPEESGSEYSTITFSITHKPNTKIQDVIFRINQSALLGRLKSQTTNGRIFTTMVYELGIPFGKHKIEADIQAQTGESAQEESLVNNTYRTKPTLHLVAIGINEFPYLPSSSTLKNAVNDAKLVKKIFETKGKHIFQSKMEIMPHLLSYSQTTKKGIEDLVNRVRQQVKPNDYFVMFVSSHGLIKNNKYYFTPSDFSYELDSKKIDEYAIQNGFGDEQISDYLINIPTIFRMVILDTCHAGQEVEHIKSLIDQVPTGRQDGISVLASAKNTQLALDVYKGQGLFTYILAEGLKGKADYNGDAIVDSMEIAYYVQSNVGRVARTELMHAQDAVVMPNPKTSYNRRFELTYLEQTAFNNFRPNIFTPRESELYLQGIERNDSQLMNGIINNNERHKYEKSNWVPTELLESDKVIDILAKLKNIDFNLMFDSDSSQLPPEDIKRIELIANALNSPQLTNKKIFVEGHTDSDGERDYNQRLSQKRVNTVIKIFRDKFGVSKDRMLGLGLGEQYPLADNRTNNGKTKNRRVSIFIYDE